MYILTNLVRKLVYIGYLSALISTKLRLQSIKSINMSDCLPSFPRTLPFSCVQTMQHFSSSKPAVLAARAQASTRQRSLG